MKPIHKKFLKYIYPFQGNNSDYDQLMHHIADASVVLLGEATHGTHEFYASRAEISKRLIKEKGFNTIAIEGDFPATYRVNRYINFQGDDSSAQESLDDFERFPAWMWRNEEIVSLIEWLRNYNKEQTTQTCINMFGLDLYSLHQSIEVIIASLQKIDPQAAQKAREYYQCFDAYQDPQQYGYAATIYPTKSCQEEVLAQLMEMKKKTLDFYKDHNLNPQEEKFYIEQNALVVKNAERYYRSMFEGTPAESWNIRDKHMMEMVLEIENFNKRTDRDHKIIIWAHNSHIGDARATQMASYGELNIGQLAKKYYGAQAVSVGYTTYEGTVSAASAWGADVERKNVRPALDTSIEAFFHDLGTPEFLMIPSEHPELYEFFNHDDYLERAIGVVYLPESERQSHYFYAQLSKQFDAVIHYDTTHAVTPLERSTQWEQGEDVPETFPFGV